MTPIKSSLLSCWANRNARLSMLVVAAAIYVVWLGNGCEWNNQMGQYWVNLKPWLKLCGWDVLALTLLFGLIFFICGRRVPSKLPVFLTMMLIIGQVVCLWTVRKVVIAEIPWGIDHPAFMFRLKEFRAVFPRALGGYNPWWNGGTEHFIGVTSGAHAFGLLNLPLLLWRDPHHFHGAALAFWLIVGFPWLGVLSVRSAGVRWTGALCAGLLLLSVNRAQFLFSWQSGNVGAMAAAMLSLPVVALSYRLVVLRRGGWVSVVALALAVWLMSLWTPCVCIGGALLMSWLWMRPRWSSRSNRLIVAAGLIALVLVLPWFWVTLVPSRGIVGYVATKGEGMAILCMLQNGFMQLFRRLQEWHPLLLWFGIGGTLFAGPRSVRRWMLPVVTVLAAMIFSVGIFPQSQLDRMSLPLGAVMVFPAAIICGQLLDLRTEDAKRGRVWCFALMQGFVAAMLLMGIRVAHMHYANQGGFKLWPMPQTIREFTDWIRQEVPEGGRFAFAGSTDWKYEWGKPTYLPVLAQREMMADDYYSYPKGLIARNFPPKAYRQSLATWLNYTHAYGITHWSAADERHQGFLDSHPEKFEKVHEVWMQSSHIKVYRVKNVGLVTRFLEGRGRVEARENCLVVYPHPGSAERIVLRYNWREGLFCRTPGASIAPYQVDDNLQFIAINPGDNAHVKIGYRPGFSKLKPNFDGSFHH